MDTQVEAETGAETELVVSAGALLRAGGLVGMPTETVYGLAANALDSAAVAAIFATKGRPSDNPLIVHVCSLDVARPLLQPVSALAEKLAAAFWPGPLTIVLPLRPHSGLSPLVTCGLPNVGIRVPSHPVALAFLKAAQVPVAAPSANRSGSPSPTTAAHVRSDFPDLRVLDGGPCEIGLESTVVKVTEDDKIRILRPGKIAVSDLARFGLVELAYRASEAPEAPGMKYKHYSPKGEVFLVSEKCEISDKSAVLIAFDDFEWAEFRGERMSLGRLCDLEEASRRLFGLLRRCDDVGASEVYVDVRFDQNAGIGQALWNRVSKAASKH